MRSESAGNRDPLVIAEARRVTALPKTLVEFRRMDWKKPSPSVPQYKWRAVAETTPVEDVELLVTGFFRATRVPGRADRHAFTLVYDGAHRVVCVEGGVRSHTNRVGRGLPWYGKTVGEFQAHSVCDEAVDGYADQLDPATGAELWDAFMSRAAIVGAPSYAPPLPEVQRRLFPDVAA